VRVSSCTSSKIEFSPRPTTISRWAEAGDLAAELGSDRAAAPVTSTVLPAASVRTRSRSVRTGSRRSRSSISILRSALTDLRPLSSS
jgi:hypothetical protein